MSREEACAYIGVSTSKFDQMVRDGRMPNPKRIDSRTVWDRFGLDKAFNRLPGGADADTDYDWTPEV